MQNKQHKQKTPFIAWPTTPHNDCHFYVTKLQGILFQINANA